MKYEAIAAILFCGITITSCSSDRKTDATPATTDDTSQFVTLTDAVLLTRNSCDPLNRRSIRVSMGSVFLVPWTWLDSPLPSELHQYAFKTAAMALTDQSIPIDHPQLKKEEHLALVLGTEGDGLPDDIIADADYVVRIPMSHQVDSLNVAAAAAVAFWEVRDRSPFLDF